jgi:FixJ family two-component response regulator
LLDVPEFADVYDMGMSYGESRVDSAEATVFIIDDDPDVRHGLARLLRAEGRRAAAYAGAEDFLADVPADVVGCILLDVALPGLSGPQLHDQLCQRGIGLPVIYLTGESTVAIGVNAMKQGALDFLEKPVDADILLPLIETAIARNRHSRAVQSRMGEIECRLSALSVREREVLDHVIAGRLNKQIAFNLGIAEKTVKVHRGRMMSKLRVRSVAELVHMCDEMGISRGSESALA